MFNWKASDLMGKKVFDASGSLLGSVTDVQLRSDKAFSLIVSSQGRVPGTPPRELTINANEIAMVKDVILLKTGREAEGSRCPQCGYRNATAAKYCRECGSELKQTEAETVIPETSGEDQF